MFLDTNQKKARKEFSQNYIDSDYTKMVFTDGCVLKVENNDAENGVQI